MTKETQMLYALGGLVALGVLIGAGASGVFDEEDPETREDLRKKVQDFFTVSENCETIEYTGSTDPGDIDVMWDDYITPYIAMTYPVAVGNDATTAHQIAAFVLDTLFPGCAWPPGGNPFQMPTQHLVWARFLSEVGKLQMAG